MENWYILPYNGEISQFTRRQLTEHYVLMNDVCAYSALLDLQPFHVFLLILLGIIRMPPLTDSSNVIRIAFDLLQQTHLNIAAYSKLLDEIVDLMKTHDAIYFPVSRCQTCLILV
jgi:hypothetical protein